MKKELEEELLRELLSYHRDRRGEGGKDFSLTLVAYC